MPDNNSLVRIVRKVSVAIWVEGHGLSDYAPCSSEELRLTPEELKKAPDWKMLKLPALPLDRDVRIQVEYFPVLSHGRVSYGLPLARFRCWRSDIPSLV